MSRSIIAKTFGSFRTYSLISGYARLRFVVMRDQTNKKDHEESAQLAAESAGAIRTISSLTREDECLRMYSKALEGPEKKALKAAIISNIVLGFVVGVGFVGCLIPSINATSDFEYSSPLL